VELMNVSSGAVRAHINGVTDMTYTDMTKTGLNDLLPENLRCKNASQLKKTSKAELIDLLERRHAHGLRCRRKRARPRAAVRSCPAGPR